MDTIRLRGKDGLRAHYLDVTRDPFSAIAMIADPKGIEELSRITSTIDNTYSSGKDSLELMNWT
jgi:hypothetical protein